MTVELLSFANNKGSVAKAASFSCSKYLKEELASERLFCADTGRENRPDFKITETEISHALNAVGGLLTSICVHDLLLVYGPIRCHIGFPAWRICYTQIV
ncbi:hypothetical protein M5K25_025611 [Dendrobium thyrsiflorum]|uniref:ditrans,polycis-polyprenyl diphosphate synthase [(2E,6E)-farnesyldiphosphate specific] n=1 Tax=Dendrobium thyrsiflorum TaxID=117978 RepID=A0ABD0U4C7_DENTH